MNTRIVLVVWHRNGASRHELCQRVGRRSTAWGFEESIQQWSVWFLADSVEQAAQFEQAVQGHPDLIQTEIYTSDGKDVHIVREGSDSGLPV